MDRSRLAGLLLAAVFCAVPGLARDTVYVDLSGIDNIVTNPPLTDAQKAELKALIIADMQANFDVAGVDIQVTDDPTVSADRTVTFHPEIGSYTRRNGSTGYKYGDWPHGSRACNVYLGNFFNRHGEDYKTNGEWDLDKLRKGIGRTAAHEVAHSYSVGHNKDTDFLTKMTEGGLVGSSTRANTEWIFDEHSGEVMRQNLGKPPCQTAADYDADFLQPYFWEAPLFPNPEYDPNDPNSDPYNDLDEYDCFDVLVNIDGFVDPTFFDVGWYGVDTDDGLIDGNPDFDFIYKVSLAEPEQPEQLLFTIFETAHATVQPVLRGRPGSPYEGQWFTMDMAEIEMANPVTTPSGDQIYRCATLRWDVDMDGFTDVNVMLDAYMLYSAWGAEYNGWTLEHIDTCVGDLNHDGMIDLADLAIMLASYGIESGALYENGDLNGDRAVDLADLALLLTVYDTSCTPPYSVPPGDECWHTLCDGNTVADFSENPIPPDYFAPGSDPFDGTIILGGMMGLDVDTILRRIEPLDFEPPWPAEAQTSLDLMQMELTSCEPVAIVINGETTFWAVYVHPGEPQPPGTLVATMTDDTGGYFTAEFMFSPVYEFTRTSPPYDTVIFDTAEMGIPPVLMSTVTPVSWSIDETYEQCTLDGFAGGVRIDPEGTPRAENACFMSVGTSSNQQCLRRASYPECPE